VSYPPGNYGGPPGRDPYGQQPGYGQQPPYGAPNSGAPSSGVPSSGPPSSGPPSSGPPSSGPPSGPGYGGYQEPYGQQPGFGAPADPYGQQPGYSQPGMPSYGGPPPKRSHTGLLAALGSGILVLVVAIVVVAIYAFGGSSGSPQADHGSGKPTSSPTAAATDSPEDVVDKYLTAIFTDKDGSAAKDLVCSSQRNNPDSTDPDTIEKDFSSSGASVSVTWTTPQEISETSSKAKVKNTLTIKVSGTSAPVDVTWTLKDQSGWKICDVNAQ
jgi:hypothetical protein